MCGGSHLGCVGGCTLPGVDVRHLQAGQVIHLPMLETLRGGSSGEEPAGKDVLCKHGPTMPERWFIF